MKDPGISVNWDKPTIQTIVGSINDYLKNNKTVSDFHLMKDIVDRNCDAKEEEINTQIPVPLYLGLAGTMLGIIIGVVFLVFSGELNNLLGTEPTWFIMWVMNLFGAIPKGNGVETLLGGVAIAMIASFFGIILTTWASNIFKIAKSQLESDKHIFLSWIQAKLLPTLSDNVVGAIREMTENLNNFNSKFAENTGSLDTALEKVNESYKMQVKLLDKAEEISKKAPTEQILKLHKVLQKSTGEIATLATYLNDCNQYLANVRALNTKLDDYENRTQFIEKASQFYSKHEHWLAENYDEANRTLKAVVDKYNKTIEKVFIEIKTDIEGKRQELGAFIEAQNKALTGSAGDLDKIVKALSELGEVQKAVKAFKAETNNQTREIRDLANKLEKWATAKETGGNTIVFSIPNWLKITVIAGFGVLILSGFTYLISIIFG
ncbi:MAG: hypothetical protein LBG92_06905 [Prevotellaceae bacterium]|nr:hypothetical protein [Prevotellaceae bacterium]